MAADIPRVSLHQPRNHESGFEVFTRHHLFSRKDRLNPPLDLPHRVEFPQIPDIQQDDGTPQIDFRISRRTRGRLRSIAAAQAHAVEVNLTISCPGV